MKLTKVIATIGPSSESEDTIKKLIELGVNVFRLNFKHADATWHKQIIQDIQRIANESNKIVGILLDLQGPEIRLRTSGDSIQLDIGSIIELKDTLDPNDPNIITVTQPEIIPYLQPNQTVIADDGYFQFQIIKDNNRTLLKSLSQGTLKNRKTLNLPGADIPISCLSETDFIGLELASQTQVDYIALSFVRDTNDIAILQSEIQKRNITAQIVTKIETQKAIDNLVDIIQASDAIMIARGDLAVELSYEQVPYLQRLIISKCIEFNKPVITATQMLESMIANPFPTRAEVSDVATATYEYSDAVMLSGESASGKYPIESVHTMIQTVSYNETKRFTDTRKIFKHSQKTQTQQLCNSAYDLYLTMIQKGETVNSFIVFTQSGNTARLLSKFHPQIPIISICPNSQVARSLSLNFGITPIVYTDHQKPSTEIEYQQIRYGIEYLQSKELLQSGSKVIVLYGDFWMITGSSSTIKILTV